MEMLPDNKLGVTVLTNSDASKFFRFGVVRECLKQAVKEKYGIEPTPPDLPTYVSLNDPSEIQGIYVTSKGYDKIVDNGDGSLNWTQDAQADDAKPVVLTYQEDVYSAEGRTESIISRSDSSIRVVQEDGKEKLLLGGYRGYAIGLVPAIASGEVVTGTVSLFKSDWYKFNTVVPGQTVKIEVSTDPSNYALTVFDWKGNFVAREMGTISWTSEQGSYYVAISPTPDASGNYTMSVN